MEILENCIKCTISLCDFVQLALTGWHWAVWSSRKYRNEWHLCMERVWVDARENNLFSSIMQGVSNLLSNLHSSIIWSATQTNINALYPYGCISMSFPASVQAELDRCFPSHVERATPDLRGFLWCCLPWHLLFLLRKAEFDHCLFPCNTATVQNEIGSTRTKKRNQLWYPLLLTQKALDHKKNGLSLIQKLRLQWIHISYIRSAFNSEFTLHSSSAFCGTKSRKPVAMYQTALAIEVKSPSHFCQIHISLA